MNKKVLTLALAVLASAGIAKMNAATDDHANHAQSISCCQDGEKNHDKDHKDHKGKKDKKDNDKKVDKKADKKRDIKRSGRPDMFNGIELTDVQKSKIDSLRRARHAKMKNQEREGRRESMQAMENDLKGVLTPEQYAQYEKNREAMRQHNRHNHKD